ncbi:hypothetical protein NM688_g8017 [Phlebia brevispora]|uniref:Uncharacterized protein n=1 Tax=Phlebia brevispora TaxID=194682 RepID=A0ACC1RYG4_9APHY|nr:hypothetical protein NM688_g8017 [Phlebia brevispora]
MGQAAEVYAEQLNPLSLGHPLWFPDPIDAGEIQIGDVGYIDDGSFQRLFNIMVPADHMWNSSGVPGNFKPFVWNKLRKSHNPNYLRPGVLGSKTMKTFMIKSETTVAVPTLAQAEISFKFECSGQRGALLVLNHRAECETVNRSPDLEEYITRNHRAWHTFVSKTLRLKCKLEELVCVSGWVKTSEWTVVAVSRDENSHSGVIKGQLGTLAGIGCELNITEGNEMTTRHHSGPLSRLEGSSPAISAGNSPISVPGMPSVLTPSSTLTTPSIPAMPSASTMPSNSPAPSILTSPSISPVPSVPAEPAPFQVNDQSVFIQYYKVQYRTPVKTAAEPHRLPDPDRRPDHGPAVVSGESVSEGDTEMELEMEPSEQQSESPLDALLKYLLENTDAEIALASHGHLYDILKHCSQTTFPNDLSGFLRSSAPSIRVRQGAAVLADEVESPSSQLSELSEPVPWVQPQEDRPAGTSSVIEAELALRRPTHVTHAVMSSAMGGILDLLRNYIAKWIVDHRSTPDLEEAVQVVARIDRTMTEIQSHTHDIIAILNGGSHFRVLQARQEKIHNDLNILREQFQTRSNLRKVWKILITDLNLVVFQIQAIQAGHSYGCSLLQYPSKRTDEEANLVWANVASQILELTGITITIPPVPQARV